MLKLSTKGRYGLRAMIELASAYGEGALMMSAIADRQEISRKYLHALLTSLKDAGLVRAVRGARGGFLLAKEPTEIKVSDIFEALEGRLSVVDCVTDQSLCTRIERCETWNLWKKLNDAMLEVLEGVTLDELVPPAAKEAKELLVCGGVTKKRGRGAHVQKPG